MFMAIHGPPRAQSHIPTAHDLAIHIRISWAVWTLKPYRGEAIFSEKKKSKSPSRKGQNQNYLRRKTTFSKNVKSLPSRAIRQKIQAYVLRFLKIVARSSIKGFWIFWGGPVLGGNIEIGGVRGNILDLVCSRGGLWNIFNFICKILFLECVFSYSGFGLSSRKEFYPGLTH